MTTPTPHPSVMTASARAFHHRHRLETRHVGGTGDDPYDLGSSNDSDDGHRSGGSGPHASHGGGDDMEGEHPPLEENAFAHLMEAHFGVHSAGGMDESTPHGNDDDGGDEDNEWASLDSQARTPLYTGATSSRYFCFEPLSPSKLMQ